MGLDLDALKNKKARRTSRGLSLKEGDTILRFLPHTSAYFRESLSDIALEFRSHFLKAEGADTTVVRCLRDKSEPCPFCEIHKKYKESTDLAIKKVVEQIRGGERHLFNVLNLNDLAAGVQTYETGPKIYDDVLAYIANPEWGDMLSPTVGRNWTITMTPQGKTRSGFQEYRCQPHPNPSDITPHLPPDFMDRLDAISSALPEFPDAALIARWLDILGFSPVGAVVPASVSVPAPVAPSFAPAPIPAFPVPVAAPVVAYTPPTPLGYTPSAPVAAPAVPMAPPVAAAPAPIPTAPPVAVAPPAAPEPTGSPAALFAAAHSMTSYVDPGTKKEVPQCFSQGEDKKEFGFNPAKYPCNSGCPVKADCQLKSLGIPT